MTLPFLTNGHVVITGKVDGFDVSIEGDIKDIKVSNDAAERDLDFFDPDYTRMPKSFMHEVQYTVRFKNAGGTQLTYRVHPQKVKHVVTLPCDSHPAKAIKRYQKRAKAPDNHVWQHDSTAMTITFRWDEDVYE